MDINQCKSRCDGEARCHYFLYKNELNANAQYHCALFKSCTTSHSYGDGDKAITCEIVPSEFPSSSKIPSETPFEIPSPVSYQIILKKNNILGFILSPPAEFILVFSITPYSTSNKDRSILRFSNRADYTDHNVYGDRAPFFHLKSNYDIGFRIGSASNPNHRVNNGIVISNEVNKIKVEAVGDYVKLFINDVQIKSSLHVPLSSRPIFDKLLVYGGYKYYNPADAVIQNLVFSSVQENINLINFISNSDEWTKVYGHGTMHSEMENVAFHGTASQSATGHGGIASRAIDSNTSGKWHNESVTHTANGDP